jgi:hypothetical protein
MKNFVRTTMHMFKTRPAIRLMLLGLLGAVVTGFAIHADAVLPITERTELEHAVLDKQYGDVLATQLDGIYSVTITTQGKFSTSNVLKISGFDASRAHHSLAAAPLYAKRAAVSAMLFCYLGTTPAARNITATAVDSMVLGTNGGFIPVVTGKAGWVILNSNGIASLVLTKAAAGTYIAACALPNGRVTTSHGIAF